MSGHFGKIFLFLTLWSLLVKNSSDFHSLNEKQWKEDVLLVDELPDDFDEEVIPQDLVNVFPKLLENSNISFEEFFLYFYRKKSLFISRNDASWFSKHFGNFTSDDFLFTIRSFELKFEDEIKIVKNGQTFFTDDQPAKVSTCLSAFMKGATILLNRIQYMNYNIHQICWKLERVLGIFVSANAYLTPPDSIGFNPHFDTHDVIVLQLEGSKQWKLCHPIFLLPQYRIPITNLEEMIRLNQTSCWIHHMNPGDLLYLPAGTIHEVVNNGKYPSLHITIGIMDREFTWASFLKDSLDETVLAKEIEKHIQYDGFELGYQLRKLFPVWIIPRNYFHQPTCQKKHGRIERPCNLQFVEKKFNSLLKEISPDHKCLNNDKQKQCFQRGWEWMLEKRGGGLLEDITFHSSLAKITSLKVETQIEVNPLAEIQLIPQDASKVLLLINRQKFSVSQHSYKIVQTLLEQETSYSLMDIVDINEIEELEEYLQTLIRLISLRTIQIQNS